MMRYILLVEDNADDIELARRALAKAEDGLELIVARDGKEAFDACLGAGAYAHLGSNWKPRLILLDLHMPKLNGLVVLQLLRSQPNTRHTPIIIVSASKEETDQMESETLGADAFIDKPLTADKLEALLKRYPAG